jgi:hypothetical protein
VEIWQFFQVVNWRLVRDRTVMGQAGFTVFMFFEKERRLKTNGKKEEKILVVFVRGGNVVLITSPRSSQKSLFTNYYCGFMYSDGFRGGGMLPTCNYSQRMEIRVQIPVSQH